MSIIIDLVFIALIVINILSGRKKGFAKIVLSFAAMIVTWFIASELSMPVAEWANQAFAGDWLTGSIEKLISGGIENGTDALIASIPDYVANAAEIAGVSFEKLVSELGNTVDPVTAAEEIYKAIVNPLVLPVLRIVSFYIIYSVMNVICAIVINLICKVFKLPVIKRFNKLFGGVVGALRGVVIAAVISIALGLAAMVIPATSFALALDKSIVHGILSDLTHLIFGS